MHEAVSFKNSHIRRRGSMLLYILRVKDSLPTFIFFCKSETVRIQQTDVNPQYQLCYETP